MYPYVCATATAFGALAWLWLMHNRSLPLEGCHAVITATAALAYYALVVAPAWYWACPWLPPAWEIRLLLWMIVYLWASVLHAHAYTEPLLVIVATVLILLIDAGHVQHLEPVQIVFGLVVWRWLLLDD